MLLTICCCWLADLATTFGKRIGFSGGDSVRRVDVVCSREDGGRLLMPLKNGCKLREELNPASSTFPGKMLTNWAMQTGPTVPKHLLMIIIFLQQLPPMMRRTADSVLLLISCAQGQRWPRGRGDPPPAAAFLEANRWNFFLKMSWVWVFCTKKTILFRPGANT